MPAVSVLGICVERTPHDGHEQDAVLVTRFLDYAMSYRYVFSHRQAGGATDQLIDAMVELLVRLHLAGLYWGDCSLSNTLFRPDAGTIAAYLVDAETAELHPALSDGQRLGDIDYAAERVGGELFDLQDGGLLPADVDPIAVAHEPARALLRAVGRADPRGGVPPRRAALPRRGTDRAAERARVRRRRAGAGHRERGHPAARAHPRGRDRPRPAPPLRAHRARGHREPGAAAAQRRGELPRLPRAEGRQTGARDGGRATAGAPRCTTA